MTSDVVTLLRLAHTIRTMATSAQSRAASVALQSARSNLASAADELDATANELAGQHNRWLVVGDNGPIYVNAPDAATAYQRAFDHYRIGRLLSITPDTSANVISA